MDIVLDSNVLFRVLISQGEIVNLLFDNRLKLFAPEILKEEFFNNKQEIISKSKLSETEFETLSSILFDKIAFVPLDEYKAFLPNAKKLLSKHEKDEDFVALCLFKCAKIWTYESLLFEIGVGISTKQISDKLKE